MCIIFKGICKAEDLIVSAPSDNNKKPWKDVGAVVTSDNSTLRIFICL